MGNGKREGITMGNCKREGITKRNGKRKGITKGNGKREGVTKGNGSKKCRGQGNSKLENWMFYSKGLLSLIIQLSSYWSNQGIKRFSYKGLIRVDKEE